MCRHCQHLPSIAGTQVCRSCVWRLTQMAFYPERFAGNEVDQVAGAHRETVVFAVTTKGRQKWVWVAEGWPGAKDDSTLR